MTKKDIEEIKKVDRSIEDFSVEQLLYIAIRDTDYETVEIVLKTTNWEELFEKYGKVPGYLSE